jgi:hypothetical protein
MEILELAETIGLYAGTAAFFGLALLIPLYFSQARDLQRLREWADLAPDRGTAEFQAAEAAGLAPAAAVAPTSAEAATLPRIEPPPAAEPASAPAPQPSLTPPAPQPGTTPSAPIPAAERVTRERPAAARVTTERPALVYADPWWRRFLRRPDPRYLVAMVVAVLAVGVGGALLAVRGAEDDEPARTAEGAPAIVPEEVEVTVLNGTAVTGLAAAVGDDVKTGGFNVVHTGNTVTPFDRSIVMYERGHEEEAEAVAKQLGVGRVEVIDSETRELAEGADVVVNAGEDRVNL